MYIFCTTCPNRTVTPSWCAWGLPSDVVPFPSSRLAAAPKRRWSGRDGGTLWEVQWNKRSLYIDFKEHQIIVLGSLGLGTGDSISFQVRNQVSEFFFGEGFLLGSLNFKLRLLFRWVHSIYCLHVNIGRQRLLSTSGRACHDVLLGWTCWCLFY